MPQKLPATSVLGNRISDCGTDEKDGKDWGFGETVRSAQAKFYAADGFADLVTSTDEYGYSDPWHYDSAGYVDLGEQFAETLISLRDSEPNAE